MGDDETMNHTNITPKGEYIYPFLGGCLTPEEKTRIQEREHKRQYGSMKSRAAATRAASKSTEKRKAQRKRAKAARKAQR